MKLKKLSVFEFDEFAEEHPLGNYHQSSSYAMLASEEGFDYDLLGLVDDNNVIHAAALILTKKLNMFYRYGYSPKGFLIDYYNSQLLDEFTKQLKKYYYKKNFAFIKINPEISIGTINPQTKIITYNKNQSIDNILHENNFRKMEGCYHFETKLPRYNAILILKNTTFKSLSKNTRNKINKSKRMGMTFEKAKLDQMPIIYEFIKRKKDYKINHYYNYYNAFNKKKEIDLFLVKINFEEALINLREAYEKESSRNSKLVERVMENPNEKNLNKKLYSDNMLTKLKENITIATQNLAENKEKYIAGAITIKYKNRIYILISGFDEKYKMFCPNYFLHWQLVEYYKDDYDFLDLNGITGDFTDKNPYKGLNSFKEGFNPLNFEYIGEYDFIINDGLYKSLDQKGLLAKEFKRKEKTLNEN